MDGSVTTVRSVRSLLRRPFEPGRFGRVYLPASLCEFVPSANRERVGFMTRCAASAHRTVKIFWLHFKEAKFILICCVIKKKVKLKPIRIRSICRI